MAEQCAAYEMGWTLRAYAAAALAAEEAAAESLLHQTKTNDHHIQETSDERRVRVSLFKAAKSRAQTHSAESVRAEATKAATHAHTTTTTTTHTH
jgi:hypothetical protein